MGGGSSILMPSKAKMARAQRASRKKAVQDDQSKFYESIMKSFDASKTGSLLKDEVRTLMETIMVDVSPMMGGVTDDDVDQVMRIGGTTVKPEITYEELPVALSILLAMEEENKAIHELFVKHDTDKTGNLPIDQLKTFLTAVNSGVVPLEKELKAVIAQFDLTGDGAIELPELKAAIAAWFTLADDELPNSREEALAMGYTPEEIDAFIKEVEAIPDDEALLLEGTRAIASGEAAPAASAPSADAASAPKPAAVSETTAPAAAAETTAPHAVAENPAPATAAETPSAETTATETQSGDGAAP